MTQNTILNIKEFINTKQNAKKHKKEELVSFIENLSKFTNEEITQWLKAVKTNGLDDEETSTLTLSMAQSGVMLSWEGLEPTIDKHSTGGIGDKITLLFAPLIAAYGINIPKLSGRALGFTGGTIDKLESIYGFKTNLSIGEIKEQVKKIGIAICSASGDLAPADKKLYAIRDVTNTVDSIPLIASSVMSKKIAGGAKNIILDVKCGSGAFMKSLDDSVLLGTKMVSIGKNLNKNVRAVISNMDEPLGYAIGNALEVKEVLEVLQGKEIHDLVEVVICLAKEAVSLLHKESNTPIDLEKHLRDLLLNGKALEKFESMIVTQGGTLKKELPSAKYMETITSSQDGYISHINALSVGEAVHALGAGRKQASDNIDHSVGIVLCKKYGDKVKKGEPLVQVYAKIKEDVDNIRNKLISAIIIEQNQPGKLKLIHKII